MSLATSSKPSAGAWRMPHADLPLGRGAIYGRRASLRREDDVLLPETAYGRHQVDCEQAVTSSGVGYLIARIPNAVGHPQRAAQLVPALVQQVTAGRVAVNPGASRDLIDAADVAALVSGLLRAGARNVTVNVASGIAPRSATSLAASSDSSTRPPSGSRSTHHPIPSASRSIACSPTYRTGDRRPSTHSTSWSGTSA